MKASDFYDLVSGRRRGVAASLTRSALAAAEGPYRVGVWWRNRRYDRDSSRSASAGVPVVSVGNLTLGGVGKTPVVKWVARRARAAGVRVAVLSRGYGARDGQPNDEALELEWSLPDVPHLKRPDRVLSAQTAVEELATQLIVLDDGFQHRRLRRDLDLVLLDATQPFGFGRVFPRGALREPVASLRRAHAVCLTRSDLVDEATRESIRDRVARVAPDSVWSESVMRPNALLSCPVGAVDAPEEEPIDRLAGERVAAFCGIGNPTAFRSTLDSLGAVVVAWDEWPDHHAYERADLESVARNAEAAGATRIVCTQKDLVKVRVRELAGRRLQAVAIEAELTAGAEGLTALIDDRIAKAAESDTLSDEGAA